MARRAKTLSDESSAYGKSRRLVMWKKKALLIGLGCIGLLTLAARLLSSDRLDTPDVAIRPEWNSADLKSVVSRIDQSFADDWKSKGIEEAPTADSLIVARRISLGLMGTVPSLEEIRVLQSLPEQQRIPWWLEHVFSDRRYADFVAERLARGYVGTKGGQFVLYRRRRFVTWLSDQLTANRPYDDLVRDLVAGTGIWTDKPAVNFVTVTLDNNDEQQPDPVLLAGKTARAFLGMRIDCLQCHDDRLGNTTIGPPGSARDGQQQDFHQLAAFFSEAQLSLLGVADEIGRSYRYKFLHAEKETVVHPVVPFGQDWVPKGGTRRHQLAAWLTDHRNKPFARAIVNRMWAILFGQPLVEPIDDIPLYGPFPPAMDILADDFINHDYDLRRLITVIVASRPFQIDSAAPFEITNEHQQAWAVFPLVRLRPEQIAGAIVQTCSLTTINARSPIIRQLTAYFEGSEFVQRYGDKGEDEFVARGGTITQRLLLMNGKLVQERTADNPLQNASTRITALCKDPERAVDVTYLCSLARLPTEKERRYFAQRLKEAKGSERQAVIEDLFWALINSTEFSWNH